MLSASVFLPQMFSQQGACNLENPSPKISACLLEIKAMIAIVLRGSTSFLSTNAANAGQKNGNKDTSRLQVYNYMINSCGTNHITVGDAGNTGKPLSSINVSIYPNLTSCKLCGPSIFLLA